MPMAQRMGGMTMRTLRIETDRVRIRGEDVWIAKLRTPGERGEVLSTGIHPLRAEAERQLRRPTPRTAPCERCDGPVYVLPRVGCAGSKFTEHMCGWCEQTLMYQF